MPGVVGEVRGCKDDFTSKRGRVAGERQERLFGSAEAQTAYIGQVSRFNSGIFYKKL